MADSDSSSSDLRIDTDSSDDDSYVEYVGTFPRGGFNDVAGNPGAIDAPGENIGYAQNPNGPPDNYFYDDNTPRYDFNRHTTMNFWFGRLVVPINCNERAGDELSRLWSEFRDLTLDMHNGHLLDYDEFEPAAPLREPNNWDLPCEQYTTLLSQVVANMYAARRNRSGPVQL